MKGFTIHDEEFCLQEPTLFITLTGKIFAKSQKIKKFSTFRIFRFFRLFEQKSPGMGTFRLFDFSRSKIVLPARRAHSLAKATQEIQGPMEVALPHLYDIIIYPYYTILFVCNPMISQALEKMHHHNIPSLFNHDFTRLSSLQLLVEESMDPEVLRGSFWVISPTQN